MQNVLGVHIGVQKINDLLELIGHSIGECLRRVACKAVEVWNEEGRRGAPQKDCRDLECLWHSLNSEERDPVCR